MFMLNDKPLALDVPFTHNEIQYPANWLRLASTEDRDAIGVTEVADPQPYDQRFYWGVDNPKQLDDIEVQPQEDNREPYTQTGLKSQWIGQVKDTAGKMLAASDWMVVRQVERQVEIPAAVAAKRAAIVAECDRLEAAILAVTTVEALIEVINGQQWPST